MPGLDANRVALHYREETTYGTPPTGAYQTIRMTNESLQAEVDSVSSNELRADRQVPDLIRTAERATGDVNGELSYGSYDDFFRHLLQDTAWSTAVTETASDISFDGSTGTIASAGSGFTGFAAGSWIVVSGTSNNDGIYKLTAATTSLLTVQNGANLLTTESAGSSFTVKQITDIVVGTTLKHMTIIKEHADASGSDEFAIYDGMTVATCTVETGAGAISTVRFGFLGSFEDTSSDVSATATSYVAASTTTIMNAVSHVERVSFGGVAVSQIRQFSINFDNNLRARTVIGQRGAESIGTGTMNITGSMTLQFNASDTSIVDEFHDDAESSFSIAFKDPSGNRLIFDYPRIKYSANRRNATGINEDVLMEIEFTAILHGTELTSVRIAKNDGP